MRKLKNKDVTFVEFIKQTCNIINIGDIECVNIGDVSKAYSQYKSISGQGKEIYIEESEIYELENFRYAFKGTDYENADLEFYHESLVNWGMNNLPNKKSRPKKINWVRTARGFMLRDRKDGKLILAQGIKKNNITTLADLAKKIN